MTAAPEVVLEDGLAAADGWGGWVRPDAPERFAAHAAAAAALAGPAPVRWVTWRHANLAAVSAVRRDHDVAALVRTLDHLLAGHVLAHEAMNDIRPDDEVICDIGPFPVYEFATLLSDVLRARSLGVARWDLGPWLTQRRADFDRAVPPPAGPIGRLLRVGTTALIAGERALPRAVTAVYATVTCGPGAGDAAEHRHPVTKVPTTTAREANPRTKGW